jgi:glycosyltransferase involved in cell wall biosynthesis
MVTNPPIVPALVVYLYSRLTGAGYVLDSHPRSFGRKASRAGKVTLPLHRFLARRALTTLVCARELADEVAGWGAEVDLLYEAPPLWELPLPQAAASRRGSTILWIQTFATDDPVSDVLDAARLLPGVEMLITGDLRRAPGWVRAAAPPNVRFVGLLDEPDYVRALADADAALVLTTATVSVPRSGFDAVAAGKPLVISDWPSLRDVFPEAIHVENTAPSIADGIAAALAGGEVLRERADAARDRVATLWHSQRSAVAERLRRAARSSAEA